MADYGWTGAAAGTKTMVGVASQMMHDQNLMGMQANRLAVEKQRNDILEKQTLEHTAVLSEQRKALEAKRQQMEEGEKEVNLKERFVQSGMSPEIADYLVNEPRMKTYTRMDENGQPMAKKKFAEPTTIEILKDPASKMEMAKIGKDTAYKNLMETKRQLGDPTALKGLDEEKLTEYQKASQKLKPEDKQALQEKLAEYNKQYEAASYHFTVHEKEFNAKTKQTGLTFEQREQLIKERGVEARKTRQTPPAKAPGEGGEKLSKGDEKDLQLAKERKSAATKELDALPSDDNPNSYLSKKRASLTNAIKESDAEIDRFRKQPTGGGGKKDNFGFALGQKDPWGMGYTYKGKNRWE